MTTSPSAGAIGFRRFDSNCCVCRGAVECKGGGNEMCLQRNPLPSVLAGIVDIYGGLRFVVTQGDRLKYHVRPGELLIIAPGPVHEPIAWNDIPYVVAKIEYYVREHRPNTERGQHSMRLYQLRCLEQERRSLDLSVIVET